MFALLLIAHGQATSGSDTAGVGVDGGRAGIAVQSGGGGARAALLDQKRQDARAVARGYADIAGLD